VGVGKDVRSEGEKQKYLLIRGREKRVEVGKERRTDVERKVGEDTGTRRKFRWGRREQ
jgi:hypothetical protein